MRNIVLIFAIFALFFSGCKKQPAQDTTAAPANETKAPETAEEAKAPATEVEKAPEGSELVAIDIELPRPMFVGTPQNLSGIENLEVDTKKPRPPFYAPAGVTNLAAGKPVTSSEMDPFIGTLDMIVDGDKETTDGSVVELGSFEHWVVIDLEDEYELYAVVVWHYHKTARVYQDVVVEVSSDPDFLDVTTLFNNDMDNSLGQGMGTDQHYVDKAEGKLIDAKGIKGRYVRLWSQENNQNDLTHYIEVEVYGK